MPPYFSLILFSTSFHNSIPVTRVCQKILSFHRKTAGIPKDTGWKYIASKEKATRALNPDTAHIIGGYKTFAKKS